MVAKSKTKRKHTRVPYSGRVDLHFPGRTYTHCQTRDLCLSGMRVLGACLERQMGDRCVLEFHDAGVTGNRGLRLEGEVVRVERDGVALLFVDMNYRNYAEIEAIVRQGADDPYEAADAFLDEVSR